MTGSSHAYFGYSSNPLWKDHGVTGYVLASPAQRPKYTYYLLKEALKYQKPKVIMYETFGMYYKNDDGNEGDLRKACDAMRLGSVKLEMVNDICKDMTFDEKMSYYFPIIKYHSRWSELDDWDFVSRELFLHGSRLTMETRQYPPNKKGHWKPVAPNKTSMEYLKKIAGLCKQYDIPLVLFATPVNTYKEKVFRRYYGINLTLQKWAKEEGIPFVLYQNMDLKLDPKKDFVDMAHLNYLGQIKQSKAVNQYLVKHYALPDHRNDKRYQSWEEDYQKYLDMADEKLKEAADGSNIVEHR